MFYDISTHFPSLYSIGTNSDLVPKDSYVSSILPHSTQYDNCHNLYIICSILTLVYAPYSSCMSSLKFPVFSYTLMCTSVSNNFTFFVPYRTFELNRALFSRQPIPTPSPNRSRRENDNSTFDGLDRCYRRRDIDAQSRRLEPPSPAFFPGG